MIALHMGCAPSVMQCIIIFVFVCLATLVMAITAPIHHSTMKQVMEIHQLPAVCLESVGVHLDTSFRTIPVWERKKNQLKKPQMETYNVITIFAIYLKILQCCNISLTASGTCHALRLD
jgi:hypothetical protein